jgi:hypothetical protein
MRKRQKAALLTKELIRPGSAHRYPDTCSSIGWKSSGRCTRNSFCHDMSEKSRRLAQHPSLYSTSHLVHLSAAQKLTALHHSLQRQQIPQDPLKHHGQCHQVAKHSTQSPLPAPPRSMRARVSLGLLLGQQHVSDNPSSPRVPKEGRALVDKPPGSHSAVSHRVRVLA